MGDLGIVTNPKIQGMPRCRNGFSVMSAVKVETFGNFLAPVAWAA
jgi:hypothetical protein